MNVSAQAARRFLVTRHLLAPARSLSGAHAAVLEAYNKGLSLLPTAELPWYRTSLGVNAPRILAEHAEVAERVLERIRAEGPLSTLDFERGPAIDWAWAPTNVVRAVLEASTVTGVLGLARHQGNRRHYDLIERLFPRPAGLSRLRRGTAAGVGAAPRRRAAAVPAPAVTPRPVMPVRLFHTGMSG